MQGSTRGHDSARERRRKHAKTEASCTIDRDVAMKARREIVTKGGAEEGEIKL